jgi:transposase
MPKKIDYTLTETEAEIIQKTIKQDKRAIVRQRATAIHMLHLGWTPAETARSLAVSPAAIYNWHARWREQGVAGLVNGKSPGRPPKATPAYVQLLEKVVAQDPPALGYAFTVWTVARLIEHMAQATGIRLSPSRFRALLHKHGYVYRRPKHDLKALQDAQARTQAAIWLDELKRGRYDETSPSSLWTKAPSGFIPSCASAG